MDVARLVFWWRAWGLAQVFKGDSFRLKFRETHLWEHFSGTDKIALITCLQKLDVSMEKKAVKKNHIKEFGGRNAQEASQGKTQGIMWKFQF